MPAQVRLLTKSAGSASSLNDTARFSRDMEMQSAPQIDHSLAEARHLNARLLKSNKSISSRFQISAFCLDHLRGLPARASYAAVRTPTHA